MGYSARLLNRGVLRPVHVLHSEVKFHGASIPRSPDGSRTRALLVENQATHTTGVSRTMPPTEEHRRAR